MNSVEVRDKARSQEPSESKTTHNDNASLNDNVIAAASSAVSSMTGIRTKMDYAEKVEDASKIAVPHYKDAVIAAASSSLSVNESTLLLTDDFRCAEDEEITFLLECGKTQMLLEQAEQGGENKKIQSELEEKTRGSVSELQGIHENLKSGDDIKNSMSFVEMPKVEDASDGEDEWSVVDDDDKKPMPYGEKSRLVSPALSPVVLAKWDTELRQLHEMGFLDDRSNVDSLEHLEAAHMGVDSTEKVSVNSAVEHLLGNLA